MAGVFYYLAMIAASSRIYGTNAPVDVYISMFCHGAVYLCGFVTIGTEKYDSKNAPLLILGVLLVAVRAALLPRSSPSSGCRFAFRSTASA